MAVRVHREKRLPGERVHEGGPTAPRRRIIARTAIQLREKSVGRRCGTENLAALITENAVDHPIARSPRQRLHPGPVTSKFGGRIVERNYQVQGPAETRNLLVLVAVVNIV